MRPVALAALVAIAAVGCGTQAGSTPSRSPEPASAATASAAPATTGPAVPSASARPSASASPATPADPLPDGPVTALLVGTDSRDLSSWEGNADAVVVAQLSADRSTLALISVSRDSWVTIPGHGEAKLNAAFALGGAALLRETVSELFGGIELDYTVQTNFGGFLGLLDAVDGAWVANPHPAVAGFSSAGEVDLEAGNYDFTADPILLDDAEALYYVRQRFELPYGDLDRAHRTRETIIGLMERLDELGDDPPALTSALVHIASSVRITGELRVADMVGLAGVSRQLERDDILSIMAPIAGFTGRAGASVNLVDAAQTAALGEALRAGDVRAYVDRYGTDYRP
ncbi:transcriptional regulator [Agrococcus baldri]|uniref:Transcriptional regulator n=2 Tax=Agrococcus baldri TaxID=153730 RepID=A0AA87RMV4_9MICO|nr:transcriptional regulator [Agrococcus baldri]